MSKYIVARRDLIGTPSVVYYRSSTLKTVEYHPSADNAHEFDTREDAQAFCDRVWASGMNHNGKGVVIVSHEVLDKDVHIAKLEELDNIRVLKAKIGQWLADNGHYDRVRDDGLAIRAVWGNRPIGWPKEFGSWQKVKGRYYPCS